MSDICQRGLELALFWEISQDDLMDLVRPVSSTYEAGKCKLKHVMCSSRLYPIATNRHRSNSLGATPAMTANGETPEVD